MTTLLEIYTEYKDSRGHTKGVYDTMGDIYQFVSQYALTFGLYECDLLSDALDMYNALADSSSHDDYEAYTQILKKMDRITLREW